MKKPIIALSFLILLGCVSGPPFEYDKSIFSITPDVELTALGSNSYVREKDGHTLVQITGISSETQTINYKVEWYDANGIKINSAMSKWQPKRLIKGIDFTIDSVSPTPRAIRYKVTMSENLGDGILHQ